MRKNKDVKFLIYQSLYIFVVCVIAIKGANLDLKAVIEDDGTPVVRLTEHEMDSIQTLLKKSVMIDTTQFVVVPKDLLEQNEKLKSIVQNMPKIDFSLYTLKASVQQTTPQIVQQKIEEKPEEKKEEPGQMQEIRIGNIEFTQYTNNTLNNPYDVPLEIVGVTTIPPKSSKTFQLGGETTVTVKVGTSSKTINAKDNKKPKISMNRMAPMGAEASVSSLQRVVGYRVTIDDDFPGQLDVKFSGPVTIKQSGPNTYDVTLNAFGNKAAFERFIENKDEPYNMGFTVTVSDKIAGHKITGQGSYQFGDW